MESKNLLSIIERRLNGRGGDPVIQIQTPFGGGKTHTLIAMYHKASDWHVEKSGAGRDSDARVRYVMGHVGKTVDGQGRTF